MIMYQLFSEISNLISGPFGNAAYSTNIAFLAALFLVLIGLFLLGWVKLPGLGYQLSALFMNWSQKLGRKGGAFLMGMAFSIGFCPTMFALFFGSVMPMVLSSSYGFLLPPVFAIGTAMPLLLFAGLVVGFGMDQMMVRKTRQWGRWIQILAGLLFIVLGISDTITYWTL
jgi:cytochrome c-type biogenesis protein